MVHLSDRCSHGRCTAHVALAAPARRCAWPHRRHTRQALRSWRALPAPYGAWGTRGFFAVGRVEEELLEELRTEVEKSLAGFERWVVISPNKVVMYFQSMSSYSVYSSVSL